MTEHSDEQLAARAMEEKAYKEAVRLLLPLAERNSEYALLSLGWIYETGATGAPDKDAARSYYEHAASQGSATAHLYLGRLLLRNGQDEEAKAIVQRGQKFSDEDCRSALAELSDKVDEGLAAKALKQGALEEAIHLLTPLAHRNSEYALLCLGSIYEKGAKGDPDEKTARGYYERAVAGGSAVACYELGRLLLGQGEEAEARPTFEIGAKRGSVPCMWRLGKMMVEGRGGPFDQNNGTVWLRKAATEGHIFAQRTLLAIEEHNAQSIFEKIAIRKKIAALAMKGGKEMLKDPYSDKIR